MRLREFDPSRHLDSEEAIAAYLEAIMEEDPSLLTDALGDMARARGMTEFARGVSRDA